MNSRDIAHEEDRAALASLERRPLLMVFIAVVAIIASTALVYGIANRHSQDQLETAQGQIRVLTQQAKDSADKAQAAADAARSQALAGCQLYKLIAEGPLATPTSPFALNASVGARVAYATALCDLGPLTAPDPRVAAQLPPGVH